MLKRIFFAVAMVASLAACAGKAPAPEQAQMLKRNTVTPTEGQTLTQVEGERVWYSLPAHAGKVVQSRYQEDGSWKLWQRSKIGPDGSLDQHVTDWNAPIYYSVLDQSGNPVLSWTTNVVKPGQGISSWSPEGMRQPLVAVAPPPVAVQEVPPTVDNRLMEAQGLYQQAQGQVDDLESRLKKAKDNKAWAQRKINEISKSKCKDCRKDEYNRMVKTRDAAKRDIPVLERQLAEAKVNRDVAARVYQAMSGGQAPTLSGMITPVAAEGRRPLAATGIPQKLTPSGDRCGSQSVMDQDMDVPSRGQKITQKFGTAMNYRNFPGQGTFRTVHAEWLSDSGQWRPMDRGFPLNIGPSDSGHMRQFFCGWTGDGAKNKTLRYVIRAQGGGDLGSWEVKLQ